MKGIVFTEFLELVEKKFGLKVADDIISSSHLKSGGAYTSVGTYDQSEIFILVSKLSQMTNIPIPQLVKVFGTHLLEVFVTKYGDFFKGKNTFEFLKSLDDHIHVEVKKLYPDADLPKFTYEQTTKDVLTLTYSSTKPLADLAEGLIEATIRHFGENIFLETTDLGAKDGTNRQFLLKKS